MLNLSQDFVTTGLPEWFVYLEMSCFRVPLRLGQRASGPV
jgi:hypothetical protein